MVNEEAKSLHWGHNQVIIHSCVVWRPSVPSNDTSDSHVKEYWLISSDDMLQDLHIVYHNLSEIIIFQLKAMQINFMTTPQRTDGCAAQYKTRNSFGDISNFKATGIACIANFSASGYGKGEVDSAAGYMETSAPRTLTSNPDGQPILTTNDLLKYAGKKT